jgi:hypothetical protein
MLCRRAESVGSIDRGFMPNILDLQGFAQFSPLFFDCAPGACSSGKTPMAEREKIFFERSFSVSRGVEIGAVEGGR